MTKLNATILDKKDKPKIVREKQFYMMLLTIALPITMQNLIVFFVQMVDTVMLGEIGDVAMSASSLANQPFFIFSMLVFGLSSGAAVITSQYWGKQEMKPIKVVVTLVMRVAMVAGLLLTVAVFFFPVQIMSVFTNDIEVINSGADYLKIIAFSYFFFGFSAVFYNTIRSVESVKIAVISNVAALVTNVTLNYILIFGKLGFPALGVKGAAYATLIARIVEFIIALTYMLVFDKKLKLRIKDLFLFDKVLLSDLIKISIPVVINELMWAAGMSLQAVLLGNLGTHVVAANSIINVVFQLSVVAVFGVANAAAVIIGKAIGEGDMVRARDRGYTFKIISIFFGILVSGLIILLRGVAIDFYNVSAEAKELAHQMIYVTAFIGFFVSIAGISIVGVLRGGGDTKFTMWAEIVALLLVAVPAAYFTAFVLKAPVVVVYLVMKLDEPIKAALCLIRMKGVGWIKNVTRDNLPNKEVVLEKALEVE